MSDNNPSSGSNATRMTARKNLDLFNRSGDLIYMLWSKGGSRDPRLDLPEQFRIQASPDTLEQLRANGILTCMGGVWDVSYPVGTLLDSLSQEQVVPIESVRGLRTNMEKTLDYYTQAREAGGNADLYYAKLVRMARAIMGSISTIVEYAQHEADTAFRYERNFSIKRSILSDCLNQLDLLRETVAGSRLAPAGLDTFFKISFEQSTDTGLQKIGYYYKDYIDEVYGRKSVAIATTLIDHLRKVDNSSVHRRKVEMLTKMYYASRLDDFSNYFEVMSAFPNRFVAPRGFHLSLSADFDEDEDNTLARYLAIAADKSAGKDRISTPLTREDLAVKDARWEQDLFSSHGIQENTGTYEIVDIINDAEDFIMYAERERSDSPMNDVFKYLDRKNKEYAITVYIYLLTNYEWLIGPEDDRYAIVDAENRKFKVIESKYITA